MVNLIRAIPLQIGAGQGGEFSFLEKWESP